MDPRPPLGSSWVARALTGKDHTWTHWLMQMWTYKRAAGLASRALGVLLAGPPDEPFCFAVLCVHPSPLTRAPRPQEDGVGTLNTGSEAGAQQEDLTSPVGAWADSLPSRWF